MVRDGGPSAEISNDYGAERARTADPHVANVVLSQLSYCPPTSPVWAGETLNLIFFHPSGSFEQGLDELVDMVIKDHQADPLMAVILAFVS